MRDAYPAALTRSLGLNARDLAEIGGFSERHARDLINGNKPFQPDVRQAIWLIQEDVDVMTDQLHDDLRAGREVIYVYRDKAELRAHMPEWPGRGHAQGGFPGPHYIAAITAIDAAKREDEIDADLVFLEPSTPRALRHR